MIIRRSRRTIVVFIYFLEDARSVQNFLLPHTCDSIASSPSLIVSGRTSPKFVFLYTSHIIFLKKNYNNNNMSVCVCVCYGRIKKWIKNKQRRQVQKLHRHVVDLKTHTRFPVVTSRRIIILYYIHFSRCYIIYVYTTVSLYTMYSYKSARLILCNELTLKMWCYLRQSVYRIVITLITSNILFYHHVRCVHIYIYIGTRGESDVERFSKRVQALINHSTRPILCYRYTYRAVHRLLGDY